MANISFVHETDHASVLFVGELDWEASHELVSTIETVVDHYFYTEVELLVASLGGDTRALAYYLNALWNWSKKGVRFRTRVISTAASAGAFMVLVNPVSASCSSSSRHSITSGSTGSAGRGSTSHSQTSMRSPVSRPRRRRVFRRCLNWQRARVGDSGGGKARRSSGAWSRGLRRTGGVQPGSVSWMFRTQGHSCRATAAGRGTTGTSTCGTVFRLWRLCHLSSGSRPRARPPEMLRPSASLRPCGTKATPAAGDPGRCPPPRLRSGRRDS